MLGALLRALLGGAMPAWPAPGAADKVQVCHFPPGNPRNYHTITISVSALPDHLAHGDLPGPCEDEAACAHLCDDGNKCTTDGAIVNGSCVCAPQPVDCDDGNRCTVDSCDPMQGCVSTALVCVPPDACSLSACDPMTGLCVDAPRECDDNDPTTDDRCDPATGFCQHIPRGDSCAETTFSRV
jgi:hypothetical protein